MHLFKLTLVILAFSPIFSVAQPSQSTKSVSVGQSSDWILSDLVTSVTKGIRIAGKPEPVNCKYGKALLFNGSSDGIFLDQMPLEGLKKFTVELIMCPYSAGNFEQRYFHSGEVKGSRVLLELRSVKTGWYLDAFIKSVDQQKTLIDSTKLHPLDKWSHIAFVVDRNKQETYVNGLKELESQIEILPLMGGKTSIGVRQNEQSWFKGAIYEIRISHEALNPSQFLKL